MGHFDFMVYRMNEFKIAGILLILVFCGEGFPYDGLVSVYEFKGSLQTLALL